MALYFNEKGLRNDDGTIFLISYRELLNECLKHPYNTVSISEIIFGTIHKVTGMKIIKKNYNKSKLYQWLEKRIRQDPRYIETKQIVFERDSRKRQLRKEYEEKKRHMKGFNMQLDYMEKKRSKYKPKKSKEW